MNILRWRTSIDLNQVPSPMPQRGMQSFFLFYIFLAKENDLREIIVEKYILNDFFFIKMNKLMEDRDLNN